MRMREPNVGQILLGLATLGIAVPAPSWAQSAIADVIVTARKQAESMQDVPVAVTSLAGEGLKAQGIANALDLGRSVPNLVTAAHPTSASTVTFTIRGQRSGDTATTVDRPVGIYADGINVARIRGMSGVFFDIARVEVLKGPQGTLYGRNTTGGAINIISRDADYNGIHGFASTDLGSQRLLAPRFAINVPLIDDKLALRVGAQGTFRQGFGRSVTTGQRIGLDRDQIIARATLIANPLEGLNIVGKAEYFHSKEHGTLVTALGLTPNATATIAVANQLGLANPTSAASRAIAAAVLANQFVTGPGDYDRTFYENPQHDEFEAYNFALTATVDLSDTAKLKSITGYRRFTNNQLFDFDGTSFRLLSVGLGRFAVGPLVRGVPGLPPTAFQFDPGPEQRNRFFSQEFNLSGTSLGDRLSWLGGFYFSREVGSDTQEVQALPPVLATASIIDGARVFNSSWSLYTQEELSITDKIKIQGGFRYTEERKGLNSRSRNFNPATNTITCVTGVPGTFPASNPSACEIRRERTFTGTSWMVGASYQATDDLLIYARVARGFRGGSFQFGNSLLPPAEPEFARETELGIKSDWFDHRLRVNLAAFNTDYTNKQESTLVLNPLTGTSTRSLQNAASATLRGFEGEFSARPTDSLTLRATVSYLWGKYDSFPGALPVTGGTTTVDASGERFADPPWTYSLGARYEVPVGPGKFGVQADWSWTAGANPSPRLTNPAIPAAITNRLVALCTGSCIGGRASLGLLSGSLDYTIDDLGLKLSVFGTNLLNKKYQIAGADPSSLGGVITAFSTEPRMFGMTIRKSFGAE